LVGRGIGIYFEAASHGSHLLLLTITQFSDVHPIFASTDAFPKEKLFLFLSRLPIQNFIFFCDGRRIKAVISSLMNIPDTLHTRVNGLFGSNVGAKSVQQVVRHSIGMTSSIIRIVRSNPARGTFSKDAT
jgi:hypothetical protein